MIDNPHIQGAFLKAIGYLDDDKKYAVSVSGGSDSDVVVDFLYQCGYTHKVDYVFFDTGIEYQATYEHLDYLEDRYGIFIQRVRANKSIPACCKEYGIPFMSKYNSEMLARMQEIKFPFEDRPYSELLKDYPDQKSAMQWWCNMFNEGSFFNIKRKRMLKEFLIENPPKFKISNKCCHYSKKVTAHQFNVDNDIDVVIMGLRRYEGGVRGMSISKCYNPGRKGRRNGQFVPDKYYPIFWLTDTDKKEYNQYYKICNSACYTKYGFTRTGCACCPYGLDCEKERERIKVFEPKIYNLTERVFGSSYDYTKKFYEFRQQHDLDMKRGNTQKLDRWIE